MNEQTEPIAAPWSFIRRFSRAEVEAHLLVVGAREVTSPPDDELDRGTAWSRYYSQAIIAKGPPGPIRPGDAFSKARALVSRYEFSDPRIARGHFAADVPLLGRTMVLELSAFGLRYLCGVRVTRVRETSHANRTTFAFRYDTVQGHIERGAEWFVLTKHHVSGDVAFRIQATWRQGTFPNWWSRVGFAWVGPRFQRAWHRLAYLRMRKLLAARGLPRVPRGRGLLIPGVPVEAPPVNVVGSGEPAKGVREIEVEEAGR